MSDFSEFNNNNCMTGYYGDMNSIAPHNLATAAVNQRGNPHFTFMPPTHGSSLSSPLASSPAHNQLAPLSAPGMGTTWQHSVPSTMPWSNSLASTLPQHHMSSSFEKYKVSTFHGFHPPSLEPQPSCSSPMKRPKRKALEYSDDAPTSKVYLCTDQFANLQISPQSECGSERPPRTISYGSQSNAERSGRQDMSGWERFREVENSIDIDCEEEAAKKSPNRQEKGVICIDEQVAHQTSTKPSSILPKSILNDITKPCLQVMLWKSPGHILRDVVKEEGAGLSPSTMPPVHSSNLSSCLTTYTRSSHSLSDAVMEDTPFNQSRSSPKMHPSVNPCRHSPSSLSSSPSSSSSSSSSPNLNWLRQAPSSQLLRASSAPNRPSAFGAFSNPERDVSIGRSSTSFLDDEMQL